MRGQVLRIYSNESVADAQVRVSEQETVTDQDGRFQFKSVEQGATVLRVNAVGYQPLERSLEVGEFQTLSIELTPEDTLVTIGGQVTHRLDGPRELRLEVGDESVITGTDGRWSLDAVPIGPTQLVIDQPPYNPFSTQVLVHTDGQEFLQTLTRDTTISWWVEHDSYVFTRDDSLNANRGQRQELLVTAELGRTAVFSLTPPVADWDWAELLGAELALHGHRGLSDGEDPGDPRELTVDLVGLDGPFFEGSIDFAVRPGFYPHGTATLHLAEEPVAQPVVLDILPLLQHTPVSFWAAGVGLATGVEQPTIYLLSSEYGHLDEEILARPRATYRLRI